MKILFIITLISLSPTLFAQEGNSLPKEKVYNFNENSIEGLRLRPAGMAIREKGRTKLFCDAYDKDLNVWNQCQVCLGLKDDPKQFNKCMDKKEVQETVGRNVQRRIFSAGVGLTLDIDSEYRPNGVTGTFNMNTYRPTSNIGQGSEEFVISEDINLTVEIVDARLNITDNIIDGNYEARGLRKFNNHIITPYFLIGGGNGLENSQNESNRSYFGAHLEAGLGLAHFGDHFYVAAGGSIRGDLGFYVGGSNENDRTGLRLIAIPCAQLDSRILDIIRLNNRVCHDIPTQVTDINSYLAARPTSEIPVWLFVEYKSRNSAEGEGQGLNFRRGEFNELAVGAEYSW